jgi:hypothetical protein
VGVGLTDADGVAVGVGVGVGLTDADGVPVGVGVGVGLTEATGVPVGVGVGVGLTDVAGVAVGVGVGLRLTEGDGKEAEGVGLAVTAKLLDAKAGTATMSTTGRAQDRGIIAVVIPRALKRRRRARFCGPGLEGFSCGAF